MDARPAVALSAPRAAPLAGFNVLAALKDAALAALITLGLSIPILSYRTEQLQGGELYLRPRWGLVALLCGVAFAARLLARAGYLKSVLLLLAAVAPAGLYALSRRSLMDVDAGDVVTLGAVYLVMAASTFLFKNEAVRARVAPVATPAFLAFAIVFPLFVYVTKGGLGESRYWVDLGILILTYVMLGWGLNIVVGLAGLLDLGYVAFYAVGAYTYALLSTTFGLSFWICLPLAGILAAFWGILLGFPVLRLRGDYLAIVTLAFGEIIRLVLINWVDLTNGGAGISSIPRVTFFGIPFNADDEGFAKLFGLEFNSMHRIIFLYYLILVLALITNFVTLRLRKLPVGRAWEALREDEIACRSLGINTTNTKLTAFAIGAMFGGFAGSFFAVRQGFVSPESFNFLESAIILAIVVLGGMGSQFGVAIAAVALIGGPELLRNLEFMRAIFGPNFDPNEYRLLIFGAGMVAMMVWRPRGLIAQREPSVVLKQRKAIAGSFVKEGHG
jgi:branched-chain amino acid transport system permease protein